MRIFGATRLHSFVELCFRRKWLLIIGALLGMGASSILLFSRKSPWEAHILIALTDGSSANRPVGDTASGDAKQGTGGAGRVGDVAYRKANRLTVWIKRTPDFMAGVIRDANLDIKYPRKTTEELSTMVERSLTDSIIMSDLYLDMGIQWPVARESEDILNALFKRFAEKTVEVETQAVGQQRQALEVQYFEARKKVRQLTILQASPEAKNAIDMPLVAGVEQTPPTPAPQMDPALRAQIENARLDLSEARSRLRGVQSRKQSTQRLLDIGPVVGPNEGPDLTLGPASEFAKIQGELTEKLRHYSDAHPDIIDLRKRLEEAKQRLDDARQQQAQARKAQTAPKTTTINPIWQDLDQQGAELQSLVSSRASHLRDLESQARSQQVAIAAATPRARPATISGPAQIASDLQLAKAIRDDRRAKLATAKLEEAGERKAQQSILRVEVPPKAERPSMRRKLILAMLGPAVGFLLVLCYSLLAEWMTKALRTPAEVEMYLGKPVLAVIPKLRPSGDAPRQLTGSTGPSHRSLPYG